MELKATLSQQLKALVQELFDIDVEIELTVPEPKYGDFATNVAMQLAGNLSESPREIAEQIVRKLAVDDIRAEIAGPGFINILVSDTDLWVAAGKRETHVFKDKTYVIEYSCPNYFKEFHAGHLYQTIAADVVARLVERSGAVVHRTNFGGDVGLHVAKALWAIIKNIGGEDPSGLAKVEVDNRARYISQRYVEGSNAYESEPDAKLEIEELNKRIYKLHKDGDTESGLAQVYFNCRQWSKDYFVDFYNQIEVTEFEKYFPESTTEARGMEVVKSHIGSVFKESQGAVIFDGEGFGVDTRVFITSQGLPTYEAKDIGLILMEFEEYSFDHRILFTGRDQSEYMKVVWKALDQVTPGILAKMTHIVNGIVKFGDGKKMSSRTGNVTTAMDVLRSVKLAVGDSGDSERDRRIYLGAVKYEFVKHRLSGDMAFDPDESVSLHGNSGPYLQYALVRARSILAKRDNEAVTEVHGLEKGERTLVRKLAEYQHILFEATIQYETQGICSYLYELAVEFNRFYENNIVIGDARENIRLAIVRCYVTTLTDGLTVLGIQAPDKM
jgi:arginyl-tRNA synthetase